MVKIGEKIRFGNKDYIIEAIKNNNILLNSNNILNWVSKKDISHSLEKIIFAYPNNTLTESFKLLNEKLNNALVFENDYVKIIARNLNESESKPIFYHGSPEKEINIFLTPAIFWSTDKNFAMSYGKYIYKANLDLGNIFDIDNKKHFDWLAQQVNGITYLDDDFEAHKFKNYQEYINSEFTTNNWSIVEQYINNIKKEYNSARITEEETVNFIVFNNSQIHLLDKPELRNLDESKVEEKNLQINQIKIDEPLSESSEIIIYVDNKKYKKIYENLNKDDAIVEFNKNFKYYNEIIDKKLKNQGFICENIFYATQWKDDDGKDVFFTILKNPDKKEFDDALKHSKHKQLRAIVGPNFNDDIYVWDAYYGTHDTIFEKYIYPKDKKLRNGYANVMFRKNDYDVWGFTFSKWFDKLGYKPSDNSTNTISKEKWEELYADDDLGLLDESNNLKHNQTIVSEKDKQIFLQILSNHRKLVNYYASKVGKNYPNHDLDKLKPDMIIPYIKGFVLGKNAISYNEWKEFKNTQVKHYKQASHHSQFWDKSWTHDGQIPDVRGKMPKEALIEMCADWCAMSKKYGNTPFEWADENINKLWKFDKNQIDFIYKTLHQMWDTSDNKPINESFEQSNLNDNFWKWFGNSKIVDKNGNPLVCYHGTNRKFQEFNKSINGSFGPGIYFTPNYSSAKSYGTKLIPVYLKMENPLWLNCDTPKNLQNELRNIIINPRRKSRLLKNFDGIIVGHPLNNIEIVSEIIVFNSNQIKSIDNNGIWNFNSNNIYESSWYGNVNWQNNMDALGNVPATIGHNLFATMFPFQFLKLCPKYSYGDDEWFDKQIDERKPYGIPFLKVDVDEKNKKLIVINHEGRHRVASVKRKEPNVDIPAAILYNKDRYTLPDINTLRKEWSIISQDGNTEFKLGQFSLYNELPKESGLKLYNIYKDKKITETKKNNIEFYDSVKDMHKETIYKTLQLIDNDKIIGYVDYIVYDDEPSIEYIYVDPQYRRNKYGTKLIQKIQALYPNSEINFGMMTDDGSKLYQSLDKTIIRNDEYNKKVKQLSKINHWLDNYGKIMNKDINDWTDDEENYLRKYADIWGKYNNKKKDIENWLENNKETQVFVKY